MTAAGPWRVSHHRGSAATLHALPLPEPVTREVWVLTPDRPALVLGSTQRDDVAALDVLADRGIDLVRRRSGGGAVLLDPTGAISGASTLWIDVVLPRGDARWHDDVSRSMRWLGEAWVEALAAVGVAGRVHDGAYERTPASALVCFAGLGPGEVVAGERKVVGISQRRTRGGARFQCLVNLAPLPSAVDAVVELLREPASPAARTELAAGLRARTATVDVPAARLIDVLLGALTAPG